MEFQSSDKQKLSNTNTHTRRVKTTIGFLPLLPLTHNTRKIRSLFFSLSLSLAHFSVLPITDLREEEKKTTTDVILIAKIIFFSHNPPSSINRENYVDPDIQKHPQSQGLFKITVKLKKVVMRSTEKDRN